MLAGFVTCAHITRERETRTAILSRLSFKIDEHTRLHSHILFMHFNQASKILIEQHLLAKWFCFWRCLSLSLYLPLFARSFSVWLWVCVLHLIKIKRVLFQYGLIHFGMHMTNAFKIVCIGSVLFGCLLARSFIRLLARLAGWLDGWPKAALCRFAI